MRSPRTTTPQALSALDTSSPRPRPPRMCRSAAPSQGNDDFSFGATVADVLDGCQASAPSTGEPTPPCVMATSLRLHARPVGVKPAAPRYHLTRLFEAGREGRRAAPTLATPDAGRTGLGLTRDRWVLGASPARLVAHPLGPGAAVPPAVGMTSAQVGHPAFPCSGGCRRKHSGCHVAVAVWADCRGSHDRFGTVRTSDTAAGFASVCRLRFTVNTATVQCERLRLRACSSR
jgi:hypothetical protein